VRKARRAKGKLETILTRTREGAFAVGTDGRVVLWNRAAQKILGWSAREVIGRSCRDVLGSTVDHGKEPLQRVEMQARTKSGRPVSLDIRIVEVPSGGPAGTLLVHLIRDFTATRELLRQVDERFQAPSAPPAEAATLTRRELEVLRLIAGGANTRRLSERLHVSPATIRNHAQNIFTKLGVHSRLEAVAYATRHRLL
jgi:PAS domain S-box-containing protein